MAGTLTNTLDFYEILTRILKAWPETYTDSVYYRHKRINTFAVITAKADQNAYNLDKDSRYKDKNYFFSRRWKDSGYRDSELGFDYPALMCVENQDKIKNLLQPTQGHKVELAFFLTDLMPQKESNATDISEQRTFEQIGADMRVLFSELTKELGYFVWSRYDDGGGFSAWEWNSDRWMKAQGYTIERSAWLKTKIKAREQELTITPRYGFWGDNLAEMPFYLTIEIQPCPSDVAFSYDYTDQDKKPDSPNKVL